MMDTSLRRFASSFFSCGRGDAPCGLAKPVPRVTWARHASRQPGERAKA